MKRPSYFFYVLLAALLLLATGWSFVVFSTAYMEHRHRQTVARVEAGLIPGEPSRLDDLLEAIEDYRHFSTLYPCYGRLYHRLSLLRIVAAEAALFTGDIAGSLDYTEEALHALETHLRCAPLDGKAWLDYALILAEERGFDAEALQAWKQSATVAPREAWLLEQRLLIALQFYPFLDEEALQLAQRDSRTMADANPNRIRHFLKLLEMDSLNQLETVFTKSLPLS